MSVIIRNKSNQTITISDCRNYHFTVESLDSLALSQGFQCVLYEKPDFKGLSQVLESVTHSPIYRAEELIVSEINSIRVFEPDKSLLCSPSERDGKAIHYATQTWWKEDLKNKNNRIAWWREAKFGCFIHWGVYSVYGGVYEGKSTEYGEHIQRAMQIPSDEYRRDAIEKFYAADFNAEEWVKAAKNAGMDYFIITAKHHDGFAMYPSEAYPFDIRMTPFHRDPMKELKEACQKHNMKFGFYYSHAFDWGHSDGAGNDWEYHNPGGDKLLYGHGTENWYNYHPELLPRIVKYYVDKKAIPQILELIKNYQPDILWFDTPHKLPLSENLRILEIIRKTAPDIVINGRLAAANDYPSFGDYQNTADKPEYIFPVPGDWEGLPTTNESYAYSKADRTHKPASFFIDLLSKAASRGGNILLNIGPRN